MAIAEAIEGAGGVLNAYTTKEITCFWNHLPFEKLELAVDVLADMLLHPLLDSAEIDRERSVVQQEIRRNRDQPGIWVSELLGQAIFGDQPMGWSTAGNEETVAAMQRQDFLDYLDVWYVPANLVVSVAGNVSPRGGRSVGQALLRRPAGQGLPILRPVNSDLPDQRLAAEARPITQTNLSIGLPRLPAQRPRPLSPDGVQQPPGPGHELPPIQGGARTAGPGLLGGLVSEPVFGHRRPGRSAPAWRRRS